MRTLAIIFVIALITVAGGIYSDAALTSEQIPSAPTVAHQINHG